MRRGVQLSARAESDLANARAIASQVRLRWTQGEPADAQAALRTHPDLALDRSIVLDLAYEDFCQRLEAGESISPENFSEKFPGACRKSLVRLLQVHEAMHAEGMPLLATHAVHWPEPGDIVLDFAVKKELGRGSFGRVYLAQQRSLGDRPVAIKVSAYDSSESDILARLRHPNIVEIYSVQSNDDAGYTVICMPYLGRTTLCDVLACAYDNSTDRVTSATLQKALDEIYSAETDDGQLPIRNEFFGNRTVIDQIIDWGAQLAGALAHAHSRGICHRDIKPSNILIAHDGRPRLLDFNLSEDVHASSRRMGGTLPYMAPEQVEGLFGSRKAGNVDARSDIFSLGVVLYEALTGKLPFGPLPTQKSLESAAEELRSRQLAGPVPLRKQSRDVDRSLALIVERCLRFDPDDRFQSAIELEYALRQQLSATRRLGRGIERHRVLASCAAAMLLGSALAMLQWIAVITRPSARDSDTVIQLSSYQENGDELRQFEDRVKKHEDSARRLHETLIAARAALLARQVNDSELDGILLRSLARADEALRESSKAIDEWVTKSKHLTVDGPAKRESGDTHQLHISRKQEKRAMSANQAAKKRLSSADTRDKARGSVVTFNSIRRPARVRHTVDHKIPAAAQPTVNSYAEHSVTGATRPRELFIE